MIAINDHRLHECLRTLPIKTLPLMAPFIDAIRLIGPFNSTDAIVDEILEDRMSSYHPDVPGIIYPLRGVDPYLRKEETALSYRMNTERDNDLYDDVYNFVTHLNAVKIFTPDLVNELNNGLGRSPCLVQLISPYTFLVGRRIV